MPKKLDMQNHYLITKSNILIEASYKLTLVEQKLILALASQIQPSDEDFYTYTLSVKEFQKMTDTKSKAIYEEIAKVSENLIQKSFRIKTGKKTTVVSWLSSATYEEGGGAITLRFDPALKPYFLQLKDKYTSYRLGYIAKLRSRYSLRIYELLKQNEKLKRRSFNIDDLKMILDAENYVNFFDFKRKVLLVAQKELEEKTDITFSFKEEKSGRKVTGVVFTIKSKEHQIIDAPKSEYFNRAQALAKSLGYTLTVQTFKKLANSFPEELILSKIEGLKKRNPNAKPIDSFGGYLRTVLEASKLEEFDNRYEPIINELVQTYWRNRGRVTEWMLRDDGVSAIMKLDGCSKEVAEMVYTNEIDSEIGKIIGEKEKPEPREQNFNMEERKRQVEEMLKPFK